MAKEIKNISVIGDGGWGTTLAIHLSKNNYNVTLWGPFPQYLQQIRKNNYNRKFLPGIRIPQEIKIVDNLKTAIDSADLIVFAMPSKYTLSTVKKIKSTKVNLSDKMILSVTKGIDTKKLLRISEIIHSELGKDLSVSVLSGPTIAMEIAKELPSTAVIASKDLKTAKKLQNIFNSPNFRIYSSTDIIGVEIGGSIKNIIALACGVCDGLGFGSNTKAAILTRGLAEMSRLGKNLGAKEKTFPGLSGLGDLVTTCVSPQSRNRSVGEKLGQGRQIDQILGSMDMVAEGVDTVKAVYKLSQKLGISMPITKEVYNIIYKNKSPQKAVSDLMLRKTKSE
ncbi:MAG: NAD(P)-dependent glycerol-3-phosphate dehydrogenase [Candidatus Omnitrophica bacterium]|nr:NAD(P)-dependent glycerol-3-phosphate dehydrogenase [Candidatus Omnitrophota bacterium]MBU1997146.1 NAD(P)-dependent glycerol-3-phosphate dehydrogenase [Candidatus Omnitrophota bacterium]